MKARSLIAIVSAAIFGLIPSLPLVAAPVSPAHLRVIARRNVPAGGPTLIASDNFDSYADATDLSAAASWTDSQGATKIKKPASDGYFRPSGTTMTYWDADAFSADHRSEITMQTGRTDGSFEWGGPAVRIQSGAASGYVCVAGNGDLYLYQISAGTASIINSDTAITISNGTKIALEASGAGTATRLKVQLDSGGGWVDKWTDQNPATDFDDGAPGVATRQFTSANGEFDDWKGYDL